MNQDLCTPLKYSTQNPRLEQRHSHQLFLTLSGQQKSFYEWFI